MNDKSHIQISTVITCIITFFLFIVSCEAPESLEPVSGAEGLVTVDGDWPDSLKGITVVAMSKLDKDNPGQYFVDYGAILEQGEDTLRYFIQLAYGGYSIVPVGLKLDPAFILANIDSFLALEDIPLSFFSNPDDITGIVYKSVSFGTDSKIDRVPTIELVFE